MGALPWPPMDEFAPAQVWVREVGRAYITADAADPEGVCPTCLHELDPERYCDCCGKVVKA